MVGNETGGGKVVQIGKRAVTIKELTVGEIRGWYERAKAGSGSDLINLTLFNEIFLDDVAFMSDLEASEMDDMTPEQVRMVISAIKSVNADFFLMRERLIAIGRGVQRTIGEEGQAGVAESVTGGGTLETGK